MSMENPSVDQNRCFCLFECECDKLNQLLIDWTSADAVAIVKSRLFAYTDPTEVFARLACVLFHREIINHSPINSTKDNLRKADIALRVASAFASDSNGCYELHSSCWRKYHELSAALETSLSHFSAATRRTISLRTLIEEVLPPLETTGEPDAESVGTEIVAVAIVEAVESVTTIVQSNEGDTPTVEPIEKEPSGRGNDNSAIGGKTDGTPSKPREDDSAKRVAVDDDEQSKKESRPRSEASSSDDDEPQPKRAKLPAKSSDDSHKKDSTEDSSDSDSSDDDNATSEKKENTSVPKVEAQKIVPKSTDKKRNWLKCTESGCDRQFKFKWLLKRHDRLHHGDLECDYVCDDCGEDFAKYDDFAVHGKLHYEKRTVVCRHCDFRYWSEEARDRHEINVHWGNSSSDSSSDD